MYVQVTGQKSHDNNSTLKNSFILLCLNFFLKINIAALRIAADKFDPDFIEKRKAALEVFQIVFLYCNPKS